MGEEASAISEDQQTPEGRGRFTIVYLIHDAFRRDLRRLRGAVRAPGVAQARAQELRSHWEFVKDQLHHHHQVEDDSLWPLVRPKLAGDADQLAVLQSMEDQHQAQLPRNAVIDQAFASFAHKPDDAAGSELSDQIDQLGVELGAHLEDEESAASRSSTRR